MNFLINYFDFGIRHDGINLWRKRINFLDKLPLCLLNYKSNRDDGFENKITANKDVWKLLYLQTMPVFISWLNKISRYLGVINISHSRDSYITIAST